MALFGKASRPRTAFHPPPPWMSRPCKFATHHTVHSENFQNLRFFKDTSTCFNPYYKNLKDTSRFLPRKYSLCFETPGSKTLPSSSGETCLRSLPNTKRQERGRQQLLAQTLNPKPHTMRSNFHDQNHQIISNIKISKWSNTGFFYKIQKWRFKKHEDLAKEGSFTPRIS